MTSKRIVQNQSPTFVRLTQRFAVWSLAIMGTFSTGGPVHLQSAVWAMEDPPKAGEGSNKDGDGANEASTEIEGLLRSNQIDQATEKLNAALAQYPDAPRLRNLEITIAMRQATSSTKSFARLEAIMARLLAVAELDANTADQLAQATYYRTLADRNIAPAEAVTMLTTTMEHLTGFPNSKNRLVLPLCNMLMRADKKDDAKKLLDEALVESKPNGDLTKAPAYVSAISNYQRMLREDFPEATKAVMAEAKQYFDQRLAAADVTIDDYLGVMTMKLDDVQATLYSDPTACEKHVAEIEQLLEKAKPLGSEAKLSLFERRLGSMKTQLESTLLREKLVGTEAPEIDATHFVAGPSTTMKELRGKVVLLDFWAVWCGPCIATFPHLIELHEKYADKGLVILGATSFYGYQWDEAAGKAVRAEARYPQKTNWQCWKSSVSRTSYITHFSYRKNRAATPRVLA